MIVFCYAKSSKKPIIIGRLTSSGVFSSYSLSKVAEAPIHLMSLIIVGRRCSNMYSNSLVVLSYRASVYFMEVLIPEDEGLDLACIILVFIISILSRVMYVSHAGLFNAIRTRSLPQTKFL